MGVVAPVYFFLLYTLSPIEKFKAADHRLTNLAYTYTILPAVLLLALVPAYLAAYAPESNGQSQWARIASLSPLAITCAQWLLATFVMPDTIKEDSRDNPRRDASAVRFTVAAFGIMSAISHLGSCSNIARGIDTVWCNAAFASAASLLWLLYAFGDLKRVGMMDQSWTQIVGSMILGSFCVGPMATFAAGWLWREEILLWRRHRSAVIPGWYEKRQKQLQAATKNFTSGMKSSANTDLEKNHSVTGGCRTQ